MTSTDPFIPFARPDLTDDELARVAAVLQSGWLTSGPEVRAFEQAFARRLGVAHAVAVSSATAGLQVTLHALGVGPGDVVVTTPYTFTATCDAVHGLSAHVLFADIERGSLNLDPQAVADAVEGLRRRDPARAARVKAVVPVHVGGLAADLDGLARVAHHLGVPLVEDAAHALPCTFRGAPVGAHGHPTVFSFYATKPLTTGEGGMIVTDDAELARRLGRLRLHGIDRDPWARGGEGPLAEGDYEVVEPGFKANLSDVAAALGLAQLERCDALHARRAAVAAAYRAAFASDGRLELPAPARPGDVHAWHLFPVFVDAGKRDRFRAALAARGVASSLHYRSLHLHRAYRERYGLAPEALPVALERSLREVSLPIWPGLTDAQVERVIQAVPAALAEAERG